MRKILLREGKDKLGKKYIRANHTSDIGSVSGIQSPQTSTLKKRTIHLQSGQQTFHQREHTGAHEAHEEMLTIIKPAGIAH